MRGPLYENEFLKISRGAWGVISKFVEVDALVSLMTTSSFIVIQSERYSGAIPWRNYVCGVITINTFNIATSKGRHS